MAKFYGKVGYVKTEETKAGVWEGKTIERLYSGDVHRRIGKHQSADKLNDDIKVTNEISIVADPFAFENFIYIQYVEYMHVKWKVSDVSVQSPRLILTLGEVYNGDKNGTS